MSAIKCGKCKGYHGSVAEVRACSQPDLNGNVTTAIPSEPLAPTDKQVSFIARLRGERRIDGLPEEVRTGNPADRSQASKWISQLLDAPFANTVAAPGGIPEKGRFTVVWPNGDRRTYRIHLPTTGFYASKGWRVVSYLAGPDNDSDYRRFGNVTEDGNAVMIHRPFLNESTLIEGLRFLLESPEAQARAGEMYAIESSNCYRCGKTLTVPTSIHRGLGPECAKLLGVA